MDRMNDTRMYNVYAENMDGKRRFIAKARADRGGNGLFDLYADKCDDEEQIVIVAIDYRKELKAWAAGLAGKEYSKGLVLSIGTKWVKWLSLYEGSKVRKYDTEIFYDIVFSGGDWCDFEGNAR